MRDSEPTRGKFPNKWVLPMHEGHRDANGQLETKRNLLSCLDVTFSSEIMMGKMAQRTLNVNRVRGRKVSIIFGNESKGEQLSHALIYYILRNSRKFGPVENKNFLSVQYLCYFPIFAMCFPSGCAAVGNSS